MRILGLDPGFANMGWCLCTYVEQDLFVHSMGVLTTQKDQRKVLASLDNMRRGQSLFTQIMDLVWEDGLEDGPMKMVDVIATEEMSHPRNASSAAKLARSWGHIDSIAVLGHIPVVQASPQDIKEAVTGSRKASKDQVKSILASMYPETVEALEGVPEGRREHPYDALGAVIASLGSEVVKMGALK